MNLEEAKKFLTSNHPDMDADGQKNVFEALDCLSAIIHKLTAKNLEDLYDVEAKSYFSFSRLGVITAKTLRSIHEANSDLSLDFILKTVFELSLRNRARESLFAFETFAKYCKKDMTEKGISYLLTIPSDIIEIVSGNVKEAIDKMGSSSSNAGDARLFPLQRGDAKEIQYPNDLRAALENKLRWAMSSEGWRPF